MILLISAIVGVNVGFEFLEDEDGSYLILDLFIVRFMFWKRNDKQ